MPVIINIGGDLVPTETNKDLFVAGEAETLVGPDLYKRLKTADFNIFNLEVPLTDVKTPIIKRGPNLIASTNTVNGIKALNANFVTIANNHILDQGEKGLQSTMLALDSSTINYAGAGTNLVEAERPFIKKIRDLTFGIYCCAEHEFSICDENSPGANPFDPLESFDRVAELKMQCDYLIVLYHGGKEHYRYPSPQLQKTCRKFIEKGANLVVCQHSHCIGCREKWNNGEIVYGQGNFLFDHSESEFWKTSLLIELVFDMSKGNAGCLPEIHYIPIVKQGYCISKANELQGEKILNDFYNRSGELEDSKLIQEYYDEFARTALTSYLRGASGKNSRSFIYRAINKISGHKFIDWQMKRKYKELDRLVLINQMECEAHRELMLQGLKSSIAQKNERLGK